MASCLQLLLTAFSGCRDRQARAAHPVVDAADYRQHAGRIGLPEGPYLGLDDRAEQPQRRQAVGDASRRPTHNSRVHVARNAGGYLQDALRHLRARCRLRDLLYDFLGNGIVAADGENWQTQRRAASHMFTSRTLRDVMDTVIKEKTLQLRDLLAECAKEGRTVDMKSLFGMFSGDTFTKIAFGVDLNGLADAENDHPFNEAVDVMAEMLGSRLLSPTWVWKLKRFLNIGDERKLKQACAIVHELTHRVMSKSMQKDKSKNDKKDVLTLLIESSSDTDVAVVRDAVMNFLLAGKDTTAFSLAWILVNLNRYPGVLAKLRQEINEKLPGLVSGEIDIPTMDDLKDLPYLEAVVKESLRLHAIATTRVPNKPVTLSDGTFVPAGCVVMMPAYATARLTSVWGEDASEYKPERWIDAETGKVKMMSPFKFGTFISGPRQCVGMRFALLEMRIATAVLFSHFDLKTVDNPFDVTYEYSFTLPIKGSLHVTVETLPAVTTA